MSACEGIARRRAPNLAYVRERGAGAIEEKVGGVIDGARGAAAAGTARKR